MNLREKLLKEFPNLKWEFLSRKEIMYFMFSHSQEFSFAGDSIAVYTHVEPGYILKFPQQQTLTLDEAINLIKISTKFSNFI